MLYAKNYMEILVEQHLDETLRKDKPGNEEIRTDPERKARVMTTVLNHIPPFYVTCKAGEVYGFSSQAIPQNKANIIVEIAKAIELELNKGYN